LIDIRRRPFVASPTVRDVITQTNTARTVRRKLIRPRCYARCGATAPSLLFREWHRRAGNTAPQHLDDIDLSWVPENTPHWHDGC
jgi:hypothetical protein